MSDITLAGFRLASNYEGSGFQPLYEKLIISKNPELSDKEKLSLLRWGLFFFSQPDGGVKRLGYRIILRYSNITGDYIPLYDIALNAGFIPVSKFIESHHVNENQIGESFFKTYLSCFFDNYKIDGKYYSEGQQELIEFSKSAKDSLIVAPTSYGKSEMMIAKVLENLGKKICIIVPSKALLAQTKRRLLDNNTVAQIAKRIITHPEMYRETDLSFIAVFTQERLLRLMQNWPDLKLDILLIDEAHNLLESSDRGTLLIQTLLIAKNRNAHIELKFYTPFIANSESIETRYSNYELDSKHVREYIKIERYYIYDAKNSKKLTLYDQFLNRHFTIGTLDQDEFTFILSNKASKNIIYLNKPRQVQEVGLKISKLLPDIDFASAIEAGFEEAYEAISDFLHPEYILLSCLKKGVIYHHGRMPEIIRLYIENIFSKYSHIPFIVTTSTLLEGINIPAEKIFLLSTKRGKPLLSRSAFKNLTGRICRFREIFSNDGNLGMLEPEIFVVNSPYANKNFNAKTFLERCAKIKAEDKEKDEVENILLKPIPTDSDEKEDLREALEYIENIEKGTITLTDAEPEIRYVESDIAKLCFKNNIHDFDIHFYEDTLNSNLAQIEGTAKIASSKALMDAINTVFIQNITFTTSHTNENNFSRLQNEAARSFYAKFLDWRARGASYKEMITSFTNFWDAKQQTAESPDGHYIYVGNAWGEERRSITDTIELYVDLRKKKGSERINLAIVRIKEEQDFVDFKLMQYIEVLNDLGLLEASYFDRLKYGSSDPKVICLLKNGISIELAKQLLNGKYSSFIHFDLKNDAVRIERGAVQVMEDLGTNKVLVFELQLHAA